MVTVLMIKKATLGFLETMLFWNKGYDVIISVPDATSESLPRHLYYIVDVVMWPKFGKLWHFFEISYYNLTITRVWSGKPLFLRDGLGSSSIIWDWH